jgi:hypothetical protein
MHPRITTHKIPVKIWAGLLFLFTVGVLALILPHALRPLAIRQALGLLAISVPAGVIVGIILRLTSRD